ncbi:MAG TPA: hypothetical protein VGW34_03820 [Allosphingosinicella sp.]|nr:hypothetical protein [Allosphingosinicella sp.]
MAVPPTYSSGGPALPARLPGVDPASRGVGLARDAAALGEAAYGAARARRETGERVKEIDHQTALIEDRRALAAATSDRAAALAKMQADLQADLLEMRAASAAGAAGHEERAASLIDQRVDDYMASLGDRRLIEAFKPDVAQLAGSLKVGETRFAIEKRADKQVTDIVTLQQQLANNLFTSPSSAGLAASIALHDRTVDALDLPEDAKAELRQAGKKAFTIRAWQGAMEADPAAAIAAIDAGDLNDVAEDGELVSLRRSAVALKEHRDALARAAAAAQLAEFREAARAEVEDVNEGVTVDAGRLDALRSQAEAAGETDLARDLEVAAMKNIATLKYAGATPSEMEEAQNAIEQSGDWRSDRAKVAAHAQLGTLIQRTRERAKSDKLSLYSENGGRLTPLVLTDPASIRARIGQARAAQDRYGGPLQLMTEAEAAPLGDAFTKGGPSDKAATIAMFAAFGNEAGKAAMRQVAPARPELATLVDLATLRNRAAGQALAREALNGWEQAKANPKLIDPQQMQAELDRRYGAALLMMDGVARQGVMDVAKGIYANRAAARGETHLNRDLWLGAVRSALGEAGDGTGGIGEASGGAPFVVPRGMTERDVALVLARSGPREIVTAGGSDAPLWSGKTMNAAQFKTLIPVMVSDGRYMFRSKGGGFARSQRFPDRNFVLDIRLLGRLTQGVR